MEKKLKILIIFLIIFIILISAIILLFYKNSEEKNNENNVNNIDGDSFEVELENSNAMVSSNDEFYNVRNCIQYYLAYIMDDNFDAVLKVMDNNYSKQNKLDINKLKEKYKDYDKTDFIVKAMNKKELTLDFIIYYIDGYLVDTNYSNIENSGFTVLIDNENGLFSVIPENLEKENDYEYNTNLIKDDDYYNEIIYKTFSNVDIIKEYFNLYKKLANSNTNMAYSLLNNEYKEKRFKDSVEKYNKFVNEIDIENSYLSKFAYNVYEDYNEYVGIDKNGLYYIFRETAPMKFEILLDTYTIETEKFLKSYKSADSQNKVKMNVDKFVMMLNNRDYEAAYNLLDNTFRSNNFSSEEDFEVYIKDKCPSFYECNYVSFEEKGSDVFVQSVELKNVNSENSMRLNVIMKLGENTDFIMSFEI